MLSARIRLHTTHPHNSVLRTPSHLSLVHRSRKYAQDAVSSSSSDEAQRGHTDTQSSSDATVNDTNTPGRNESEPNTQPGPPSTDYTASNKLFADAALEESSSSSSTLAQEAAARFNRLASLQRQQQQQQYANWTGEESMEDAVLRMLVDKYKPLRSGSVRSADEKLRMQPPRSTGIPGSTNDVAASSASTSTTSPAEDSPAPPRDPISMAKVPLLPSIEGHQPWHTTFKVPSHASSSIKYGSLPPRPPPPPHKSTSLPVDEQARKKLKEQKTKTELAGRLSRARESTLDYKLGLRGEGGPSRRPMPVSMKGWASLVEERIERARSEGQFNKIQGRGQPLKQLTEEKNPFIAREEFLMNRIVQRNGAAPPWVEIQGELETAISSFRDVLKQSWMRRAIRMLTATHPPSLLPTLTLSQITSLRDAEWEARERSYYDTAVEELNSLVRKYNGLAPYAVRRPYYSRAVEVERVYRDSAADILEALKERARNPPSSNLSGKPGYDGEGKSGDSGTSAGDERAFPRLRDMLREWMAGLTSSFR
ncbi:hypothetical protein K474DRAFT_1604113 [Panus rudis PR-1116 ss-1]|nr:hypothetical protein K474DRAFT_1604113 [Panus rudis PR-1116 ss-1]